MKFLYAFVALFLIIAGAMAMSPPKLLEEIKPKELGEPLVPILPVFQAPEDEPVPLLPILKQKENELPKLEPIPGL